MTKRQWFLVAGTLVLAACGTGTGVCENTTVSANQNHNRDEVGVVECSDPQAGEAQRPAPRVDNGEAGLRWNPNPSQPRPRRYVW